MIYLFLLMGVIISGCAGIINGNKYLKNLEEKYEIGDEMFAIAWPIAVVMFITCLLCFLCF